VIQKEAEKILNLTMEIQRMWNVKTRVITSNNWSDWNHFKIIQKVREHHTRKP
jgi:phage FluMu gp28-like protein